MKIFGPHRPERVLLRRNTLYRGRCLRREWVTALAPATGRLRSLYHQIKSRHKVGLRATSKLDGATSWKPEYLRVGDFATLKDELKPKGS